MGCQCCPAALHSPSVALPGSLRVVLFKIQRAHESPGKFVGHGRQVLFFFFLLVKLGLRFCTWALSSCSEWGLLSSCSVQAFHHNVFSCCGAQALGMQALVVVAHRLSCSIAYGIFPDQELNPCPLHWQAESYTLYHQGSPR